MEIFVEPFLFDIQESVELAKSFNIGLELYVDSDRIKRLNKDKKLLKFVKDLNQKSLHGPIHDLTPGAFDRDVWEITLRKYIDTLKLGNIINARWIVFHISYNYLEYGYPHLKEKWVKNAITLFNLLRKNVPQFPQIYLENSFEKNPEIFLDILKNVEEENFWICLDIGHINVYSDKPISTWIDELSPYIKEVHLHNNDGKGDHHWTLDNGTIDIEAILNELEEKVGEFIITLEPRDEKDLEKNLKWLKERGWI